MVLAKLPLSELLWGVFPADSGEILVDDKPINRNELTIGYLPEERGMYPKKKIIDQLVYFWQASWFK